MFYPLKCHRTHRMMLCSYHISTGVDSFECVYIFSASQNRIAVNHIY